MLLCYCITAGLFGLCFGSFANVVIWRLPREQSVVTPSSHCTSCEKALKPYHLVPVFSWLFLRGKCAYCGAGISPRYTVVELLTAALFVLVTYLQPQYALFYCGLMFVLVVVSFIDAETQYIPISLLVTGAVLGAALAAYRVLFLREGLSVLRDSLLAAIIGFGVLLILDGGCRLILKKQGFGVGDMMLMGLCGLFLAPWGTFWAYYFSFILAGVWAVGLLVRKKQELGTYFAFGPFLCMGVVAEMVVGLGG